MDSADTDRPVDSRELYVVLPEAAWSHNHTWLGGIRVYLTASEAQREARAREWERVRLLEPTKYVVIQLVKTTL